MRSFIVRQKPVQGREKQRGGVIPSSDLNVGYQFKAIISELMLLSTC